MFEVAYSLFTFILLFEVLVFLFLNLPTPRGWKAVIIRFIATNKIVKVVLKVQYCIAIVAAIFFIDCWRLENKYDAEKVLVKAKDSYAAELKYNYLSFMTLKTQRNKYITFMLIYTLIALSVYVGILAYLYQKREKYEQNLKEQAVKIREKAAQGRNTEQGKKVDA